jgi:hypothetical protein
MANKVENVYKEALRIAKQEKCLFIDHLVMYLPLCRQTFYKYFPANSDKLDNIKEVLSNNRVKRKIEMYNKWFESDNATLQVSLMKLLGNNEERAVLNNSKQEVEHKVSSIAPSIKFTD